MSSMNPFVVLLVPLLYLLVSTGVLIGFTGLLAALGQSAAKIRSIKSLQPTEPIVTALVEYLTRVFGPLHKFTPQPTHVMLVAVVVALVVNGQRRR